MILLGCIRGFRVVGVLVVSPFLFGVALLARNLGSALPSSHYYKDIWHQTQDISVAENRRQSNAKILAINNNLALSGWCTSPLKRALQLEVELGLQCDLKMAINFMRRSQ